ncbi:hypothetical protein [Desulforhabdus sp. TSK]|uniref:hypothetical protein n=1 Tax=Desulforhabdus sp. TSK TaxID=2925014 RepID=UPI001FC811EE|nr:hypothetical protein [Desulforhabdus sp. TSK]GKT07008.1 hypothetical protein DSTSK_03130 [Desulforhabdus sp. TSK]
MKKEPGSIRFVVVLSSTHWLTLARCEGLILTYLGKTLGMPPIGLRSPMDEKALLAVVVIRSCLGCLVPLQEIEPVSPD